MSVPWDGLFSESEDLDHQVAPWSRVSFGKPFKLLPLKGRGRHPWHHRLARLPPCGLTGQTEVARIGAK